jgi:hypothetical protein
MAPETSPAQRKAFVQSASLRLAQAQSAEAKVTSVLGCLDACRFAMSHLPLSTPLVHEYVYRLEPELVKVYTEGELDAFKEKLQEFVDRLLATL